MEIIRNATEIKKFSKSMGNKRIGFVPTMGALHAGHLSLVHTIKQHADKVILSIFVNPMQFSPKEDYENYPRTEDSDLEKCFQAGVDVVYIPTVADIYPTGFSTSVDIGPLAKELCGASRKNYMNGIMIVLIKLVMQTGTHCMILGEKDYQMLFLARKFFRDLDIDIEILQGNTVRNSDNLALSSRHKYLSKEERKKACFLYDFLHEIGNKLVNNPNNIAEVTSEGLSLLKLEGFRPDYLEARDNNTLEPMVTFKKPARIFVAAYLRNCRLIDNILID